MAKPVIDSAAEICRLQSLGIEHVREEWRRHYQTPPPKRLSADMLVRGIAYKLQENAFGGLSKPNLRQLYASTPLATSQADNRARRPSPKPGAGKRHRWVG